MSTRIIQNSFVGGELSPALYGRHDIAAYFKGAASLENFVVLKTGGIKKRPAVVSAYSYTTAAPSGLGLDTRIVPYRYSRSNGGLLIATEETDGGGVKHTRVSYLPKGSSGFTTTDALQSALLPNYIYPPSIKWMQVGDTLVLSGETGPAGSDGTAPSPAPAASVLINHPAKSLTVGLYAVNQKPAAPSDLTFTVFGDFIVSDTSSKARTLYYASYTVTAGVTSDARKASLANTNAEWPLNSGCTVRTKIRQDAAGNYPDEVIIAKRSGSLYGELARLQNTDFASEGTDGSGPYRQFEFRDENHLPGTLVYKQTPLVEAGTPVASGCTAMFQQRLAFAGLDGEPFSVIFSKTGDFHTFHASRPVADDDPFRITLAAETPAVIRHAVAFRDALLLFTDAGVWRVSGSATEGFSSRTCRAEQLNDIGCAPYVRPVHTTGGVIFVGSDERTVYELRYDIAQDAIAPIERSILANHLTASAKIVSIAHQRYPESVVWCALDNGRLLSFTYQPEHEVYAWAHHVIEWFTYRTAQMVAPGTVTGAESDMLTLSTYASSGATKCVISALQSGAYTDLTGRPVKATLITLRPELPDRNVQGIPKNITDCLIRVRNTERLAVGPYDAGGNQAGEVTEVPANGAAFTGNIKVMPPGLINDDGQMSVISYTGPCEIQCVVWKTEF